MSRPEKQSLLPKMDKKTAKQITKPKTPHQALNRTACHRNLFSSQLPPNLVGTIDLFIGMPDSPYLWNQPFIT